MKFFDFLNLSNILRIHNGSVEIADIDFNNGTIDFRAATKIKGISIDTSGNLTMPDGTFLKESYAVLAATGNSAATAAVIADQQVAVTGANNTTAVALPAASIGLPIRVINTSDTYSLPVYPVSGGNDNINGGAEDAAFTIGPGREAWFIATSATQWYCQDVAAATPSKTEINTLKGVTASAAELNYLDIAALGTGAASKAVVLDANGDYVFPNTSTISFAGAGSVSAFRIGNWKAAQASGNAVLFATGMDFNSDGQLDVMGSFGESTSDLTSAYSAKAGRFRHLITAEADTVFNQETYGLIGQLSVKNGSLNHYHGGLMGTFETGTLCHIQTSYGAGAVIARMGGSGTTVESGGLLAGFLSIQHMSAFTATGTMAAFATHKTADGIAWPIGLYMQTGSVDKAGVLNVGSDGLYVTVAALTSGDAYSGIRSIVTANDNTNTYGAAGYFQTDLTGTIAGTVYGMGSWINMGASSVGGSNMICAQDNGIWVPTAGAPMASAKAVIGMRMEYVAEGGEDPGSLFLFSTNIYDNALTAMFDVNAMVDTGGSSTAATGNDFKIPFIKEASTGIVWYVNAYHA